MINIQHLHKSFGKLEVLRDIQLEIIPGKVTAVLGPNGSGKTTLMKSILGMTLPDQGTIEVRGEPTRHAWNYRKHLSYVPQIAQFPSNLTVQELLQMIKEVRQEPANEDPLVDRLSLQPFLDKKLGTLSGGTRQKVNLVLALMFDAPIVLMDEPTAGLDPVALLELKRLIQDMRKAGKCIVVTTHIMPLVEELADEIVFLLDGKVYFQGSLSELFSLTEKNTLEEAIAHFLIQRKDRTSVNA
ncbi:MAG: ABC transporter ATP-binding protein [Imperialibacter sp.]|uniref:ABC transporter ATP-binding protein n=1 Tax=Imperialibacter sp. TaxID=2038411 RepID=UPI003A83FDA7